MAANQLVDIATYAVVLAGVVWLSKKFLEERRMDFMDCVKLAGGITTIAFWFCRHCSNHVVCSHCNGYCDEDPDEDPDCRVNMDMYN